MGTREDNTSDVTKCTRCGEPFVSGSGPYMRTGFPGMYHKRCLPHGPAPDQYRAGLIAGLREAAKLCDAVEVQQDIDLGITNTGGAGDSAKVIRARIAALETEEGK